MLEKYQSIIVPALAAIQFIIGMFVAYLSIIFTKKSDFENLLQNYREVEKRLIAIEHDIEHLPDKDTANNLLLEIATLNGKLEAYEERFDNFNKTSDRMQKQLDIIDHYLRKVEKS